MKLKGIIFDLDGTLLDTIEDLTDSVNYAMASLNLRELSVAEVMERVGNGFRVLLERSIPENKRTDENISIAYDAFVKKYEQCYADKTSVYKGIKELIFELSKMGVGLAVNTNKRTDYAQKLINLHFGKDIFVKVLGEGCGYPKKPEPDGPLSLAALMGCKPEEAVYIGDSQTDVQTGKNAGMQVIGVSWGFRGRKALEEYGADYVVDTPQEIMDIILDMNTVK